MSADEDEMKEMVGGCCVCSDERGWDENPLVYCDGQGCNVAVHQACYGIVTVPSGPWFCRKCESHERSTRVHSQRCELCPSKDGALKRTDQNGWAHVVCALYIPEVRFGNVSTMEPILISLIPPERFNKTCCICEDHNRGSKASVGACMQCNKQGCKQNFHVTCAQMQGLLCEEAGNMDNVKYCGYCQHHYGKLIKNYNSMLNSSQKSTRNVKIIPPFRPVPASANESPGSSPDKPGSKTGSSVLNDDNKNASAVLSRNSTPSSNNPGDSITGGKSQINNPVISPDINSCPKGSKNSKKGNSGHIGSNTKSGIDSSTPGKMGSTSIIPKIAQPILTPASFSSSGPSKHSAVVEEKSDSSQVKGRGTPHGKSVEIIEQISPVKCDDNLMIKLERVDEKNSPLKATIHGRKDLTTLELKEVVTAALDRPMTSTGNKFDLVSSTLTGGIEPPMSSTGSASSHSSRHSHGEKPAPPDIKPHVTLTPIPMRGSTTRMSLTRAEEAREEREKEAKSKEKSPASALSFHNSFGPPKLHSQNQQSTSDPVDSSVKGIKPPDLSQNELQQLDKAGPPSKRARGGSREEERVDRKTPTKGRGGRRGATNPSYNAKRDVSNGSFVDENSHDEPVEVIASSSNSTRGGRSGPGRKPGSSRLSGRPPADDPPAPTLSQLKSQMETSGESPLSALPPHMFGNALNPASSMAQRMVDTLSQEMEAVVAAGGVPDITGSPTPVIGISMPGKLTSNNTPPVNGASTSTVSHVPASAPPQTLEQLLERQWEQGSQFLMEQAQHLDIAQLLSCLNQLKQDNRALEEHVQSLVQRRDQLIAINARLSIPLGNNTTVAALGPGFNSASNGNNHNGHGTPPPTLQPQNLINSSGSKGLQVSSSNLSPQQQHDIMMQQGRHGPRDDRSHLHTSEMQVSRAEIGVAHSAQNPHNHSMHPVLNQRGQASYGGPYSGHPGSGVPSHPSHPHIPHHSSRDAPR